jgi:hypothetical protein
LTAAIEAKEGRDVMTADIPNAFVQTNMEVDGKEKMMMKIRGPLVTMLTELDSLKALYCTLQASLLFYKKLKKDLESIGFKINPYDPCVAN